MLPRNPLWSVLFVSSFAVAQAAAVAVEVRSEPIPAVVAQKIRDEGIEKSQAMRLLRDLTGKIGHRLTGSDNFTKACEWAAAEFRSMGLENVQVEKWGEWKLVWTRGSWTGRITSPVQLDMYVATDAWTAPTKGLQSGTVVRAPKTVDDVQPDALAGKWVFYTRRPGAELRKAIEAAGILGWVYRANDPNEKFPTRVRVFGNHQTAMKPLDQVPTLPEIAVRADHSDQLAALVDEGKQVVCEFDIQNSFREGPIELHNVIAEIRGTEKPDEVVIVCGHLDSWHQAQGTTDNGTGATSTMETARILMAAGAKPKRTIRFCLWGGEEQGLLGSRAYVQKHRAEMAKVSAVYNHDTGTNWAQSLGVTEAMHKQLEPVFANVTKLLVPPDQDFDGPVFKLNIARAVSGGGGSDHASFIAAGVPAWSWGLKGRSDYFQHTWHTQWDTIDVAIEEYQRHTCTVIAIAALGTANLDALLDRAGVNTGSDRGAQAGSYAAALFDAEMDGFKFTEVKAEGRAAKMGVQKGDVLAKVNGKALEQMFEIFQIARDSEGDSVTFTFKRGDKTFDATMKKDALPARRRRGGDEPAPGGERGGNRPGAGAGAGSSGGTGSGGTGTGSGGTGSGGTGSGGGGR